MKKQYFLIFVLLCLGIVAGKAQCDGLGLDISTDFNINCYGYHDGLCMITPNGGVSPYTYSWSSGQTTDYAAGLSPGTYQFVVYDNLGCQIDSSITITQPAPLLDSLVTTPSGCCNCKGTIQPYGLGGTPPYTYSWSNGGTTDTLVGLSSGTYTATITDANRCTTTDTISVYESPLVSLFQTNVLCNGDSDGSVSVMVSGTYSYNWSPGRETTSSITGLSAGIYSLTITNTDTSECSATYSFTITQPTVLQVFIIEVFNETITCHGGYGSKYAAPEGGTAPYTYLWSDANSQTTETATGLSAGTYSVMATDNNGCLAITSGTLTQPAPLYISVNVITNVGCIGANGSLAANLILDTVLTQDYLYVGTSIAVSPIQRFPLPDYISPTLTVAVTGASGGEASDFGGYGASFSGICNVTLGHVISIAIGQSGFASFVGDGEGGGGGTFVYDSNTYTPLAIAGGGGGGPGLTYLIDSGGNGGTVVFYPNNATNGVGGNGPGGIGGTGGAAGIAVYENYPNPGGGGGTGWGSSGGDGITYSSGGADSSFGGSCGSCPNPFAGGSPPQAGIFDGNYGGGGGGGGGGSYGGGGGGGYNGGGGGNDSAEIGDTRIGGGGGGGSYLDGTILIPATATNVGDGYASISYLSPGGTPPYTYSWSPNGGTNSTAVGLSAGTYILLVTDINGCSATASAILMSTPQINSIVSSNVSCYGGNNGAASVSVSSGIPPYTYLWNYGQTTATATGLSAGFYSATVTDSIGCTATTSVIIITQPPALTITTDSINATNGNCNGSAWALVSGGTAPYSYFWTGGLSTDTITNQCTGDYCATVTDANGCMDSVCVDIDVSTGTIEVKGESEKVKVYPNPSNGVFTIVIGHSELVSEWQTIIEVYDVLGEKVYDATLKQVQGDNLIDLTGQPNGVYFYRVLTDNGKLLGEGKVIIEK